MDVSDKFKTQCDEFDVFGELVKSWRTQPVIVDDDYPQWRFEFEGVLDRFFLAAMANGRFDPNSRFGLRLKQHLEKL